ncbi:MAG: beta-ketoacyl synthase N-terminal-like domain-containing protein [Flavobacterium sp.]
MKLFPKIAITAHHSIGALGASSEEVWQNYQQFKTKITVNEAGDFVGTLSDENSDLILKLRNENPHYASLDNSVLFAIFSARKVYQSAGWKSTDTFGINIGSSRGATTLFEEHHQFFLENKYAQTLASPNSTLGNIASWVSHDLQHRGPEISHSITCSTALHALLNGVAWLKAGWVDKFLVGGSEAPLTSFTLAQMKALKIYSREKNSEFPCRSLDFEKKNNSMVIGEGASMICLEHENTEKAMAHIIAMGYATEMLQHPTSISAEAICFQKSMQMALQEIDLHEIDAIVMHAPGTLKGDASEFEAIKKVFGENVPLLTSNKWLLGHTFGASGMFGVEMALLMLQNQIFIPVPFQNQIPESKKLRKIMVNAVGFGGNAVSVVLEKNG